MVLLRNDDVLPLTTSELRKVALIGPNAGRAVIMGGGSASLPVPELRSPLDALRDRLGPDVEVVHEPGVDISLTTPAVPGSMLSADGEPGVAVELFAFEDLGGEVLHRDRFASGSITWFMSNTPAAVGSTFAYRASAELAVETAGLWRLSLVQTEPARLKIDGEVVLDGHEQDLPSGPDFFGMGKRELTYDLELDPDPSDPDRTGVDGQQLGVDGGGQARTATGAPDRCHRPGGRRGRRRRCRHRGGGHRRRLGDRGW